MRVLLIYVITENVNMPVLPLGLASVAAAVEADGHSVRMVMVSRNDCRDAIQAAIADGASGGWDFSFWAVPMRASNPPNGP